MTEELTIRGKWFLPFKVEQAAPGTLTYEPNRGIYLEIEEPFDDEETLFLGGGLTKVNIILGESRDGELITLYACHRTGFRWGNSYTATWYVSRAYIGHHAHDASALSFTEIVLRVNPLFLWLHSSGIRIRDWEKPTQSVTFTYTKPDDIYFPIDGKASGIIRFYNSFSFPDSYSENIDFSHSVTVAIEAVVDKSLLAKELWIYTNRFLNWLTIVTGYPRYIEKVVFYHKDLIRQELPNGTKIRQEVVSYSKQEQVKSRPKRPDQFLFDYHVLKSHMPDVLTRWFSLYDSIEVVIQILAENMGRDIAFSEFHFKDIIQALEAFHRKRIRNERMPKRTYKVIKERILSQITDESDRQLVSEQLNYGNEPKLRERLIELIDRSSSPSIQAIIGDKENFVKQVIDNRNYHTHLDKSGKKNILNPTDLYYLSEKSLALLFATVIGEVIEDKKLIDQAIRVSDRWRFMVDKNS